jgi:hypothetical protein
MRQSGKEIGSQKRRTDEQIKRKNSVTEEKQEKIQLREK